MKIFLISIFFIILLGCSFDNKTGIWNSSGEFKTKKEDRFKGFETLYTQTKSFDRVINPPADLKIALNGVQSNLKWTDEYYNNSNNLDNFNYKDLNELIFKSKKLSQYKTKERLLYDDQKTIITDEKGSIIVYSIEDQKIVYKYNFYKKKFRKIEKKLNIITENNIIYVGDNFGYLYALDYKNGKLLWAKNFKIPFRSNLKIAGKMIVMADINNSLYFIDKNNGKKLKIIPTEETLIKNNFINSLAMNEYSLIYLNTYGSLYSINKLGKINWFINLNQSIDINPNNLFYSNPTIIYEDKIVISTNQYLYILDTQTGTILSKIGITSLLKPIISGRKIFIITKDNLLVCININSGEIIYSIDITQNIADFLESKKKSINIKFLALTDNNLLLFLDNSYLVKFSVEGKIKNINKLPAKLGSFPIFIDESMLYLNNKNKLVIIN